MKNNIVWEQHIISITTLIHEEFPELAKYIVEIPVSSSEGDAVNNKNLEEYYRSLEGIVQEYAKTHPSAKSPENTGKPIFPGYPLYPPSEDIYQQSKEKTEVNPADPSKRKTPNENEGTRNERDFEADESGDDLDVPGSELDDQQESLGSEDEENNYYSLGGENHSN